MVTAVVTAHDGFDHSYNSHSEHCISQASDPNVTAKMNSDFKHLRRDNPAAFLPFNQSLCPHTLSCE